MLKPWPASDHWCFCFVRWLNIYPIIIGTYFNKWWNYGRSKSWHTPCRRINGKCNDHRKFPHPHATSLLGARPFHSPWAYCLNMFTTRAGLINISTWVYEINYLYLRDKDDSPCHITRVNRFVLFFMVNKDVPSTNCRCGVTWNCNIKQGMLKYKKFYYIIDIIPILF